jgi:hypothetical protein
MLVFFVVAAVGNRILEVTEGSSDQPTDRELERLIDLVLVLTPLGMLAAIFESLTLRRLMKHHAAEFELLGSPEPAALRRGWRQNMALLRFFLGFRAWRLRDARLAVLSGVMGVLTWAILGGLVYFLAPRD